MVKILKRHWNRKSSGAIAKAMNISVSTNHLIICRRKAHRSKTNLSQTDVQCKISQRAPRLAIMEGKRKASSHGGGVGGGGRKAAGQTTTQRLKSNEVHYNKPHEAIKAVTQIRAIF